MQYYASSEQIPIFIEFKDRERYDIDVIAKELIDGDLGDRAQKEKIDNFWQGNEIAWQTFFNFDKNNFLREIDLSKRKLLNPELFYKNSILPKDDKESRDLERLSLHEITQVNPKHGKWLSNTVYKNFTDKDGFYYCAISGYRSKRKLDFQIDHIKPMHNGGLTVIENLQLLTKRENAKKGSKE